MPPRQLTVPSPAYGHVAPHLRDHHPGLAPHGGTDDHLFGLHTTAHACEPHAHRHGVLRDVHLYPEEWRADGDADQPGGQAAILTSEFTVCGVLMHLTAYQITTEDGHQTALQQDDDLTAISAAVGSTGPFATTVLFGRDYALIATPYAT